MRFPKKLLLYKIRQLSIIKKDIPLSDEMISKLQESMERESNYIEKYVSDIDKDSVLWHYYKFLETKFVSECSLRKDELREIISLPSFSGL